MFRLIKQFSIIYVLMTLFSFVIGQTVISFGSDYYTILPPYVLTFVEYLYYLIWFIVSPAYVGVYYARHHRKIPSAGTAWKLGIYTTPITFGIIVISVLILLYFDPNILFEGEPKLNADELAFLSDHLFTAIMGLGLALVIVSPVIHILPVRIFFPLAARIWLKSVER